MKVWTCGVCAWIPALPRAQTHLPPWEISGLRGASGSLELQPPESPPSLLRQVCPSAEGPCIPALGELSYPWLIPVISLRKGTAAHQAGGSCRPQRPEPPARAGSSVTLLRPRPQGGVLEEAGPQKASVPHGEAEAAGDGTVSRSGVTSLVRGRRRDCPHRPPAPFQRPRGPRGRF